MADFGMHGSFFGDVLRDLKGRGQIRLFIQPALALLIGVRAGVADCKAGREPYLLRLFTARQDRWTIFKESVTDAALPLCVALLVDAILQRLTLGFVRPLGAVLVGLLLVWIPFVTARALANRAWQHRRSGRARRAT